MDRRNVDGGRRHDVDVAAAATRLPALPRTVDGPVQLRIRGLFATRAHGGARSGSQVRVERPVVPVGPLHAVAELGKDVRINAVKLANFEVFSGVFREFTVSVPKTYVAADAEGWTVIGTYVGKNVHGMQVRVPRPFFFLFCSIALFLSLLCSLVRVVPPTDVHSRL